MGGNDGVDEQLIYVFVSLSGCLRSWEPLLQTATGRPLEWIYTGSLRPHQSKDVVVGGPEKAIPLVSPDLTRIAFRCSLFRWLSLQLRWCMRWVRNYFPYRGSSRQFEPPTMCPKPVLDLFLHAWIFFCLVDGKVTGISFGLFPFFQRSRREMPHQRHDKTLTMSSNLGFQKVVPSASSQTRQVWSIIDNITFVHYSSFRAIVAVRWFRMEVDLLAARRRWSLISTSPNLKDIVEVGCLRRWKTGFTPSARSWWISSRTAPGNWRSTGVFWKRSEWL